MSYELERTEYLPLPVEGIAFAANADDERVKKLEADVSLMAKSFNNMVKRPDKGVSRTFGRSNRGGYQRNSRSNEDRHDWKKDAQCHEYEGYGHIQRECPLFNRKEIKCTECKRRGHLKEECPNNQKSVEKSLIYFSDTESEEEDDLKDLLLNFVALVWSEGDEIDVRKEYHELIKNTAMLRTQVNILTIDSNDPE